MVVKWFLFTSTNEVNFMAHHRRGSMLLDCTLNSKKLLSLHTYTNKKTQRTMKIINTVNMKIINTVNTSMYHFFFSFCFNLYHCLVNLEE